METTQGILLTFNRWKKAIFFHKIIVYILKLKRSESQKRSFLGHMSVPQEIKVLNNISKKLVTANEGMSWWASPYTLFPPLPLLIV